MVLGKLLHLSADIILVSTVLAGVKRQTGHSCVLPASHRAGGAVLSRSGADQTQGQDGPA